MKTRIYLKNLESGRVLSSQPGELGKLETRAKVLGSWEVFEPVSWGGGMLSATCPAHDHGRVYTLTLPVHEAKPPMEGEPPVYTPFMWAG